MPSGDLLPVGLRQPVQAAVSRRFVQRSPAELRQEAQLALAVAAHFSGHKESFGVYDSLENAPYDEWLMNLPPDLVRAGLMTEGIAVAETLARLDSGNAVLYVGDLAVSLAEAGYKDAALHRLGAMLREFPNEPAAHMAAGYAYAALSDSVAAEAHFHQLVRLALATNEVTEVEEAFQHLIEFLGELPDRHADLQAARQELNQWRQERGWIVAHGQMTAAPPRIKVGRNQPCPCGSGRKFKRCCGA